MSKRIFPGDGAGKGINESDADVGGVYLVFMQALVRW